MIGFRVEHKYPAIDPLKLQLALDSIAYHVGLARDADDGLMVDMHLDAAKGVIEDIKKELQ